MKFYNHSKQLPFASAALALCFCVPSAFAATEFTLNDANYSHTEFISIAGGLNLSDSFTFTLDMLNGGSTLDVGTLLGANFPAEIQFFDVTGTTPLTVGYDIPLIAVLGGTFATTPHLVNGDYMAKITAGLAGVNVNLSLTATPVPEANEWVMMLAGLGLIGFKLRRRAVGAGA